MQAKKQQQGPSEDAHNLYLMNRALARVKEKA